MHLNIERTEVRDKTIKHIQFFFGGNNQIPDLAYLCDTQLLMKSDSGNCFGY